MERRSMLTPTTAKALKDEGYTINVEKRHAGTGGNTRIFGDDEFEAVGVNMVSTGSWTSAPKDHVIVGLKELPEEDFPLVHEHITFAHCFKEQDGWQNVLSRFPRGGGKLYDLEFLTDDKGRRVAAFGYHAGYAGAALALLVWAHQILRPKEAFPTIKPYDNQDSLIKDVKAEVFAAHQHAKRWPQTLVIGALGRCGGGAVQMAVDAGVPEASILRWDMAETKKGGPFPEIAESDIFINCIYLTTKIAPFVTTESLAENPNRRLSVVCDVSCDPNSPNNPVPIYDRCTTFTEPLVKVDGGKLDVIAIDHLPSLLPREASEAFSGALLPSLRELHRRDEHEVWKRAENLYHEKVKTLPK